MKVLISCRKLFLTNIIIQILQEACALVSTITDPIFMWVGNVAHMVEKRNAYILIRKPEENKQLGRTILDEIILSWI